MASARKLEQIVKNEGVLFEGLRWRHDTWWTADIFGRQISTISSDGHFEKVMDVPTRPSGLGWLPDGTLLIVSQSDHRILGRRPDGSMFVHADLSESTGEHRGLINDMVVDPAGRAWIGEFGFDIDGPRPAFQLANIYRVDPDGKHVVAASDSWFPNGMVVSADGSLLIVGETLGHRYSAYPIARDGSLGTRRTWAELGPLPQTVEWPAMRGTGLFTPDGCCLDEAGLVWGADPAGRRLAWIAEGGEIVEEIPAPDGYTFIACMLGGRDGREMLVSAVPVDTDHVERTGVLYKTTVDIGHGGSP